MNNETFLCSGRSVSTYISLGIHLTVSEKINIFHIKHTVPFPYFCHLKVKQTIISVFVRYTSTIFFYILLFFLLHRTAH